MREEEKQENTAHYVKAEEYYRETYEKASELADNLFYPFGEKDESGSRTSPEAKVRIRKHPESGFRVVFYKPIEKQSEDSKKKKKHRKSKRKANPQTS